MKCQRLDCNRDATHVGVLGEMFHEACSLHASLLTNARPLTRKVMLEVEDWKAEKILEAIRMLDGVRVIHEGP